MLHNTILNHLCLPEVVTDQLFKSLMQNAHCNYRDAAGYRLLLWEQSVAQNPLLQMGNVFLNTFLL